MQHKQVKFIPLMQWNLLYWCPKKKNHIVISVAAKKVLDKKSTFIYDLKKEEKQLLTNREYKGPTLVW